MNSNFIRLHLLHNLIKSSSTGGNKDLLDEFRSHIKTFSHEHKPKLRLSYSLIFAAADLELLDHLQGQNRHIIVSFNL